MNASAARKVFTGVALVLVAFSVSVAVSNSLRADDSWVIQNLGRARAVMIPIVPAIIIGAGLGINLKSRLLGGAVVAVGAVGFAVMMWWTILAPVLATVAVVFWFMTFGPRRAQLTGM